MKIELKTSFTNTVKDNPTDSEMLDAVRQLPANPDGWVGVDLSEYDPRETTKIGISLHEDEEENTQVFVVDDVTFVNDEGKGEPFGGAHCKTPESALESVKNTIDMIARRRGTSQ